jgi:hypothetical protein
VLDRSLSGQRQNACSLGFARLLDHNRQRHRHLLCAHDVISERVSTTIFMLHNSYSVSWHPFRYYRYALLCGCGIPSITIEGTQTDWQLILDRIDKIPEFGAEPIDWANMLRVIIRRFIRAFDEGGPESDAAFWERIVHEEAGSGVYFLSGWISAFCAWNTKGVYFQSRNHQVSGYSFSRSPDWVHGLTFDGVWFPRAWSPPEGYAEVDVLVVDLEAGKELDCTMLAGHVGVAISGKEQLDTVRIAPQWFMYVKGEKRVPGTDYWY